MLGIRRLTCATAMGVVALGAFFAAPALAAAPVVSTGAAGSITYQSATLTGTGGMPPAIWACCLLQPTKAKAAKSGTEYATRKWVKIGPPRYFCTCRSLWVL